MMRFLRAATTLSALAIAACGDSTGPDAIAGTYVLRTVNGTAPPVVVFDEPGFRLEVLSASYTLRGNRTFSSTATVRETIDGETITERLDLSGTFTLDGDQITFSDSEGFEFATATIADDDLTFVDEGLVAVYTR